MSNTALAATHPRFTRFAWFSVAYNLFVILWGAWVRITGSGAGCGEHWPTCNGAIIPADPTYKTLIEFAHRLTSGLCLVVAIILVVAAFRTFPKTHRVRRGASIALFFLVLEALLGAVLVLAGLVDKDDSIARAVVISIHLVNTFTLIGFGALTAWWAGGGGKLRWHGFGRSRWLLVASLAALVFTGMTGAVTALGDTLFPVDPLAGDAVFAQLSANLDASVHFLIRLRALHPIVAVITAAILIGITTHFGGNEDPHDRVNPRARFLLGMVFVQVAAGAINILFAAPGWLQLVHLLLANIVWIGAILLIAEVLSARQSTPEARP